MAGVAGVAGVAAAALRRAQALCVGPACIITILIRARGRGWSGGMLRRGARAAGV